MDKQTWTIAGVISAVLLILIAVMAFSAKNRDLARVATALKEAGDDLARSRDQLAKKEAEMADLKEQLAADETRINQLRQEQDLAASSHRSLEDEMRAALESKDVTISQLQGRLTVNILDRVLFDSGEAQLKPGGEAVLLKVATFLNQHPGLKVHVIGHTDNVPIRAAARSRFPSNWELSSARANAAVRFLSEQAAVDPHRLGSVGYGEFRPIADNSTPEGRARNRRIAITVVADELVGADLPQGKTNTAPARLSSPLPLPQGTATNAPAND
jgi:chemotaxis protein MotB